ncbi:MAG: hypothetical protein ACTSWL_10390 [Promethearchaeota archaeon]
MSDKIIFTNNEFVLLALFRYALHRHSYVVGIAIENLEINWGSLRKSLKGQIKHDIIEHKQFCKDLDQRYKKQWNIVLDLCD